MNVSDYIGYYEDIVPDILCKQLMWYSFDFKPSAFANHYKKMDTERNSERVRMDDVWIGKNNQFYKPISECFDKVISKYQFPYLTIERKTHFRLHRYTGTGYMSEHTDNIHHSHGQQFGFPHCSSLLFLNDDYMGGEFLVANKKFKTKKGSAIIFPSNFMYPHKVKEITKGVRWSIITWLM